MSDRRHLVFRVFPFNSADSKMPGGSTRRTWNWYSQWIGYRSIRELVLWLYLGFKRMRPDIVCWLWVDVIIRLV